MESAVKAVFRTLRYACIRLHVLCGYISKEETPESYTQIRFEYRHWVYRPGIRDIESLRWYLSIETSYVQTMLNGSLTYFLDKLRKRLNLGMQRNDEKERERWCWLNNADGKFCLHLHKHNRWFCYFQEKRSICIELFDGLQSVTVQHSYMVAKSLPTTFLISTPHCLQTDI